MEIKEVAMSEAKNNGEVNKLIREKMTEVYVLGMKVGLKTAAELVKNELKTPKEWANMSSEELIDILIHAVAKSNEIINGAEKTAKESSEPEQSQSEK